MKVRRDEEIVARQGPRVYRLAFAQLRSKADAEDVFQEVFLRYVEKLPEFESPEHEKAWFLRVTLNCCRSLWRSAWHKRSVPLDENLPFETRDQWGLHQELLRLPKKYRAVLHLFYWEDMSTAEIAKVTGSTPAAVRKQLERARGMMKELIEKEGLGNV
ncbi:sigma-70 family RNA polymerase sigma factor [bacterium D16-76]|nr:sigma-70 family RNA polymerase sigma factor [bacterium D16-76]